MKTIVSRLLCGTLMLGGVIAGHAQTPIVVTSPGDSKYTIVDLNNGQLLDVYYDTVSWQTVSRTSSQPVEFYVIKYDNDVKPDTVHGVTGLVVNSMIANKDGKWMFNDARVKWDGKELKMKDRYGRKVKWEDGKLKIKDWNSKYKGQAGEGKYKEEWDKIKWKDDEIKVEEGTKKTKITPEGTKEKN